MSSYPYPPSAVGMGRWGAAPQARGAQPLPQPQKAQVLGPKALERWVMSGSLGPGSARSFLGDQGPGWGQLEVSLSLPSTSLLEVKWLVSDLTPHGTRGPASSLQRQEVSMTAFLSLAPVGLWEDLLCWRPSRALYGVWPVPGLPRFNARSTPGCDNLKCVQTLASVPRGQAHWRGRAGLGWPRVAVRLEALVAGARTEALQPLRCRRPSPERAVDGPRPSAVRQESTPPRVRKTDVPAGGGRADSWGLLCSSTFLRLSGVGGDSTKECW